MVQPNTIVSIAILHPEPPDEIRQAIFGSTFGFNQDTLTQKEEQALREYKAAARKCIQQLSEQTLAALENISRNVFAGNIELDKRTRLHEEEMEIAHDTWCQAARCSVGCQKVNQVVDLNNAQWLGNGKWGWVMLTRRAKDKNKAVVKISDIKHANIVAKEWKHGHALGASHFNIIRYENIFLYGDDEKTMKTKLMNGYESGKLKASVKRTSFPQYFILMILEFMNAGSVQDWIDKDLLGAPGMIVILRSVAAALSHMHENGVTHNDMKPENVLLHREGRQVIVKLGDLGLAEKSTNRTSDITRYGMSALCMATGEKFGSRRFSPESTQEYTDVFESLVKDCVEEGELGTALRQIPSLMRRVFEESISMAEVRDMKCFKNIEFLDEGAVDALHDTSLGSSKNQDLEDSDITPACYQTPNGDASPQFAGRSFDDKVADFAPASRRPRRSTTDDWSPLEASEEKPKLKDRRPEIVPEEPRRNRAEEHSSGLKSYFNRSRTTYT